MPNYTDDPLIWPLDTNLIDWIQQRLISEGKINGEKSHLEMLKVDLIWPEYEVPEITYKQAYDLTNFFHKGWKWCYHDPRASW